MTNLVGNNLFAPIYSDAHKQSEDWDEVSEYSEYNELIMQDMVDDFKKLLLEKHTPTFDTDALFAKINDATKLHQFMKNRNRKRFKKFHKDYILSPTFDFDSSEYIDEAITDMAENWNRDELLAWSFIEKITFLEFAWKCNRFRSTQKKKFTKMVRMADEVYG
jgi:hypothetical protein